MVDNRPGLIKHQPKTANPFALIWTFPIWPLKRSRVCSSPLDQEEETMHTLPPTMILLLRPFAPLFSRRVSVQGWGERCRLGA